MKLEILGTGSAFAKNAINCSIIWWRGENEGILLDCGFSVFPALRMKSYAEKISAVLLTHTHQDHCGSAVTLLEYRSKVLGAETIIGGIKNWDKLLKLCSGTADMDKVHFFNQEFALQTFEVPHAQNMECRALFVDNKLLYSGDTAISLLNTPQAKEAKIIIHDASKGHNPLHASIKDLAEAPEEIKQKTYLIHYLPQDYDEIATTAKEVGLAGVVRPGDIFEF